MSQDSIGVVTTGRGKLQEWKTTQKQNLSRKSRGTLTVKWAGSRDKIFSPSGRGRTFFLTSLFIELIDKRPCGTGSLAGSRGLVGREGSPLSNTATGGEASLTADAFRVGQPA